MSERFLSRFVRRIPRVTDRPAPVSASGRLRVERLEDRSVPSITPAVATIREATAAGPQANAQAGIQAAFDAFRADLGNPNNGNAVDSQGAGRRQITWDGGDNDAAPARLPGDFFNAIAPRGAIFNSDPRIQFQVSADATPAVPGTADEFGNVNATYPTAFSVFSSPRLFTALNDNVMEVEFVIPGSHNRATVSGFGAVFTDVDTAGSTKIEFFDLTGQKIFERNVLATAGNESLSFLGVKFVGAPLAKVRITSGSAAVGPNDITQGGTDDIVVMDDFIYGEPQPLTTPRIAAASGGRVVVLNTATGAQLAEITPYPGFPGSVRVAVGDITGDGVADVLTSAGAGGSPHVKVFDGNTFTELRSFFAFNPAFTNGVSVALGNIDGDSRADIIVAAGPGGGPHVRIISGANLDLLTPIGEISDSAVITSFFAFDPSFRGGLTVSAADLNGDFLDDPILGMGSGGSAVKAVDATKLNDVLSNGQIADPALVKTFVAYPGFAGGVFVAGGDVNADGRADIITGAGEGGGPHVQGFSGTDNTQLFSFFAYDMTFRGGVRVDAGSFDDDRAGAAVVTGPGPNGDGRVTLHGIPLRRFENFLPFADPSSGVFVASTRN